MVRIEYILCPVDFFPASERAVDYAIALAQNYRARLILLHVVSPVVPAAYDIPVNAAEMIEAMTEASTTLLQKLARRAKSKNVSVQPLVRVGDVDMEIRSVATSYKTDFIVMGTHGRHGFEQWFLGSVTERLLRKLPVPLLTMSESKAKFVPTAIRRILVATDFSEGTPNAIAYALSMAREYHAKVTLMHVLNDIDADISGRYREPLIRSIRSELEHLIPKDAHDWCDTTTRVDTGLPYKLILQTLKDDKIDLLVMNVHGKGFLDRALIGSTAERVVRGAPCPVLMIPPTPAKRARKSRKAS